MRNVGWMSAVEHVGSKNPCHTDWRFCRKRTIDPKERQSRPSSGSCTPVQSCNQLFAQGAPKDRLLPDLSATPQIVAREKPGLKLRRSLYARRNPAALQVSVSSRSLSNGSCFPLQHARATAAKKAWAVFDNGSDKTFRHYFTESPHKAHQQSSRALQQS